MYKYKGKRGDIWLNEKEAFVNSLTQGSTKKVRAICPECGEEREIFFYNLHKTGHSYHVGCFKRAENLKSVLGKRFGKLVVIGNASPRTTSEGFLRSFCTCRCDCGSVVEKEIHSLKAGKNNSCGCTRYENIAKTARKRRGPLSSRFGKIGPLSPMYKSDISEEERKTSYRQRKSNEAYVWRKLVFERDKYTCQCCHKKGGKIVAHHMNGWAMFPEQRFDVDNGLTLCEGCHRKLHKLLGGVKNSCTRKECQKILKTMKEE